MPILARAPGSQVSSLGFARAWAVAQKMLAMGMQWAGWLALAGLLGTGHADQQRGYGIPTIDLAGETNRQVVVDREDGQYLGHPSTLLLEDGRTILCVYPKGHGRGAIVYKRSTDGGLTWSERLPTPPSWATSLETPTLHRVIDAKGRKRVIMWSGLYPARKAVSEDDGQTWSELEAAGDWGGIVVMGSVELLKTGPGHYLAMFHDDGRFFARQPLQKKPVEFTLYQTFSNDGGLTWAFPQPVFSSTNVHLCEPGLLRSPDGKQLAALLRENARRRNSHVIFSNDEGRSWSEPRELPGALTGDRHAGKYAPDGRLFISFRDTTLESPTKGDWVAWVGVWDDIVQGREGQYRVRLMKNHRVADCAYPGVEVLPDGTIVTTTYGHWTPGEQPYIASVRLKLAELDARASVPSAGTAPQQAPPSRERLRIVIETDAGGDPDDEQSLVRFLLYTCEWDVEGIIAVRPQARERENLNPERTGLGIVRRQLAAYESCYPQLVRHDPRYPKPAMLWQRTVPGYPKGGGDGFEGVRLLKEAADGPDPRPIWFCNWGTDHGSIESSLKLALDKVLLERGAAGYAAFKKRFRLSSADAFGEHTTRLDPPWPLWVDTFRPEQQGRRWYHRFSAITATSAGFDIERDVRAGHGPLGALYPINTTHPQKEGDTMTFLFLVPTGMSNPLHPEWGSWGGRYGLNEDFPGRSYYWANQVDAWRRVTNRDNTLERWAEALQNDFRARLDWCVSEPDKANHPPVVRLTGDRERRVTPGEKVQLDASPSSDPDGHPLRFEWFFYPEAGVWIERVPTLAGADSARAAFVVPETLSDRPLHLVVAVTDSGAPPLTRYGRTVFRIGRAAESAAGRAE